MARAKEFDVDEALWAAVEVFWRRGYTNTSIQNLVDAMGIERGSLYATYGDKERLFLKAVERYSRYQIERMPKGAGPGAALRAWFRNNLEDATGGRMPSGCLVINSAVESPSLSAAVRALVQRHLDDLKAFFRACVEGSVALGLAPCDLDSERAAQSLLAAIIGVNVMSRAGAPRAQLEQIVDGALGFLRPEGG